MIGVFELLEQRKNRILEHLEYLEYVDDDNIKCVNERKTMCLILFKLLNIFTN